MRRGAGERGQVLPLIALSLAALLGFGGLAVDVAFLEYRQQAQQTATDAAAIVGSHALAQSACTNNAVAQSAALVGASSNGFANGGSVTVTSVSPPQSGFFANNDCAISVQITNSNTSTFFTRFFGYPNGMAETTQAVAIASASNTTCMYLLSATQNSDFSNSNIDAPKCGITINASANMNNSTIDAASIGYAGTTPNTSGATFSEAAPARSLPIADPCREIPGCNYLANNPPSTSGCNSASSFNNTTVPAGCYNGLTLTGTDTLSGNYVINGQFHMNNATVSGSNVTIYMTASASDTNFSSANLTLSPPTPGPGTNTAGVLMYRVPSQSSALDLSTCTCSLAGLQYFPTTQVNYSTTGDVYSVLVFGDANFSTSHALDFASPASGQSLVYNSVLAE